MEVGVVFLNYDVEGELSEVYVSCLYDDGKVL